ncbi:hypothetical protein ACSZNU_21365 [Aeromonas hydrophila]
MFKKRAFLLLCPLLALSGCNEQETFAQDGPFGLYAGMKKKQLEDHLQLRKDFNTFDKIDGNYYLYNPPKPNPEVTSYVVKISKNYGLCWVKATGKKIKTDDNGSDLKDKFIETEAALDKRFGSHTRNDEIVRYNVYDKPKSWMNALQRGISVFQSEWNGGSDNLPEHLSKVNLRSHSIGSNTGYLTIEYTFSNFDECNEDLLQESRKKLTNPYY